MSLQERDSPVFRKLVKHYQERLNELRVQNDKPMTLEQTAHIRGQIAEAKQFLMLDKDQPVITEE